MIQSSDQEVVGSHSVQFEQIKTLIQTHNTINGMLTEYLEKMYDTKLANPKDNFLQIADNIEWAVVDPQIEGSPRAMCTGALKTQIETSSLCFFRS